MRQEEGAGRCPPPLLQAEKRRCLQCPQPPLAPCSPHCSGRSPCHCSRHSLLRLPPPRLRCPRLPRTGAGQGLPPPSPGAVWGRPSRQHGQSSRSPTATGTFACIRHRGLHPLSTSCTRWFPEATPPAKGWCLFFQAAPGERGCWGFPQAARWPCVAPRQRPLVSSALELVRWLPWPRGSPGHRRRRAGSKAG